MSELKGLEITTFPSTKLQTLSQVKTFLRVDDNCEDELIELYIDSATRDIENYLRRSLITQTLKLTLDSFDRVAYDEQDFFGSGIHDAPRSALTKEDFVYLARPPIQSITSITTYDESNASSVFASSNYTLDGVNGRIFLNEGSVWPTSLRDRNAVEIIYVGGYGDAASDVPSPIRRALLNHIRQMYHERGDCELSCSTKTELSSYKLQDYLGFC